MIQTFNTERDLHTLLGMTSQRQVFPRQSRYGEASALDIGLQPVETVPDVLVPFDDLDAVIAHSIEAQTFPQFHQKATWGPDGFRWNQDGLGYCWTWSGTAALMDCRAMEDKDTVLLAPVSMGYLVGWANRGNYLESFIGGARQDGICPAVNGEYNSLNRNTTYWAQYAEQRKLYRLGEVWDTNNRAGDKVMLQHCVSILSYGRPLFIAYNWWGHALEMVGVRWTPGTYLNVTVVIRNSHNEDDFIELNGSRCVPDEAYGFISTEPL